MADNFGCRPPYSLAEESIFQQEVELPLTSMTKPTMRLAAAMVGSDLALLTASSHDR